MAGLCRRLDAAGVGTRVADALPHAPATAVAALVTRCSAIVTIFDAESALPSALAACGAARDLVVLDLSPIAPAIQRELANAARVAGVALVGGRLLTRFRDGVPQPTLYVDDDAARAAPLHGLLAAFGDDVVTTGAPGRAKAVGVVDDLLAGVNAAVVAEAMALGRDAGLDAASLVALLRKGSGATTVMTHPQPAGDAREPHAALSRVARAALRAQHSLLFGSVAIGVLMRHASAAGSASTPGVAGNARADARVTW